MRNTAVFGLIHGALATALMLHGGTKMAAAQKGPKWTTTSDVLREHEWGDATNNLLDIVASMPEEQYAFRPKATMRSFGEIVGHITDVQFGFCDAALGHGTHRESWEKKPDRTEVLHALHQSIAVCDSAFDALTDARLTATAGQTILIDLFITMLGHTRRESGKLVAYLPIAGIKPPEIHYMRGRAWRGRRADP